MTSELEPPYRETVDRLGLEEREAEAIRVLGRWRDRMRTRVLIGSAVVGLGTFAVGFYGGIVLQLMISNVVQIRLAVLVGAASFIATLMAGRQVARIVVRRRSPALVEALAADYEVPPERLAEMVQMLDRL
jgi:glutamyl-tRNA reductase